MWRQASVTMFPLLPEAQLPARSTILNELVWFYTKLKHTHECPVYKVARQRSASRNLLQDSPICVEIGSEQEHCLPASHSDKPNNDVC
jgi:hypothetical protein